MTQGGKNNRSVINKVDLINNKNRLHNLVLFR